MFRIYKNIFKSPHLAECGEVGAGDVWRRTYGDGESRLKIGPYIQLDCYMVAVWVGLARFGSSRFRTRVRTHGITQ